MAYAIRSGKSIPWPGRADAASSARALTIAASPAPGSNSHALSQPSPSRSGRFPVGFGSPVEFRCRRRQESTWPRGQAKKCVRDPVFPTRRPRGAWMHEPKGRYLPLAGPRRFIGDLVYFARQIPSAPVSRLFDVTQLVAPRASHPARPSWACLFMKAYAIVGAENAPLRRSLLQFPWPRLYEHPWMNCALAIERTLSRRRRGLRRDLPRTRTPVARPAPAGGGLVQERGARKSGLLSHGTAVQPGTHADPAALVVGDSEHLGLQALQAVRHVRAIELRFARRRADPPHLAADDHPDLRTDRPSNRPGRRQADLRPPRA